jgi:hypothetical protein
MSVDSGFRLKVLTGFLLMMGVTAAISLQLEAGRLEKIEEEVGKGSNSKKKGGYYPFYDNQSDSYWPPYSTFNLPVGIPPYSSSASPFRQSSSNTLFPTGNWDIYAGLNYFYDVKGDLEGYGLSSRMRTPFGTLDLDATRFRERVEEGYDYLNLYYLNYCLSFGFPNLTVDVGAGYSGMWGRKSDDGVGFLLAGEVSVFDPILVRADIRYSSINGTAVGDYRAGLGVVFTCTELNIRYRYVQIEKAPSLHGTEASIGVRF